MASTVATTWLPAAYTLLHMAGFEASLADTAVAVELGARLLITAGSATVRTARGYPLATLGIVAAAGLAAWRAGYLNRDRLASTGQEVVQAAQPWLAKAEAALDGYQQARSALTVIEPYGLPTVEQLAARYLARAPGAVTVPHLFSALASDGYPVAADYLETAVRRHPAFGITEGDPPGIWIGRRIIRLTVPALRR
jgi:hypothetical protein